MERLFDFEHFQQDIFCIRDHPFSTLLVQLVKEIHEQTDAPLSTTSNWVLKQSTY